MARTDGGDAFPSGEDASCGMSLRDWIAVKVLVAMMATEAGESGMLGWAAPGESFEDTNALLAYGWADAMLRARAKPRTVPT